MKWIYWKDKLPPHRELVILGSIKSESSFIGYYDKTFNTFFTANGSAVPVSHWMELPEPPKKPKV